MSRIRGKDTTPEKRVRSLLHRLGFRFRLHVRIPVSLSALNAPRPSDGRGIKGEGLRESGESFPRKETSRVEPLNCSSRRESALPLSKRRWSGLTSAATRFMEGAKVTCRTPRAVSVDILLPKYKTVIFVHGCFWHRHRGCVNCTTPTNRRQWWLTKLEGNAARDLLHQRALRKLGWRVIVVWECQTEQSDSLQRLGITLSKQLRQPRR